MSKINIYMLGRFDVFVNGRSALDFLDSSKKRTMLLAYLILNHNKPVMSQTLIQVLWGNDQVSNPENALKTMISRLREGLAKSEPLLKNCIITKKGSYQWNYNLLYKLDVTEFEDLCASLASASALDKEIQGQFTRVLQLYAGDLLAHFTSENWVANRSVYLHNLYLKTIKKYIQLLKDIQDYDTVIEVCRAALDIDTFDETCQIELMHALQKTGRNHAALLQYQQITNQYQKHLGIAPTEKILEYYKELIKADTAAEADLGSIRKELSSPYMKTAFVCDYSIFKDIYQLQIRNLERLGENVFIALITVKSVMNEPLSPLVLDHVMNTLLKTLKETLRKGDVISRYSSSQYALILPSLTSEDHGAVSERIKRMFYKNYEGANIQINFQFDPITLS